MPERDIRVVVVAYGPASRTKKAARRARRLSGLQGSVAVVPASRHAVRSCRNLPVDVSSEVGSAGVRRAFEDTDCDYALLIHDDVFLSPAAVPELIASLDDGNRYAVPYTNDIGMDHFGGSLPSVGLVDAPTLKHRSEGLERKPVRTVRPSCLVARTDDLIAFAERPLTEPNLRVDDIDLGFVAAPVLAAHDGSCSSALGPPESADGKPLLVAAMIVRDEEGTLPELFASIEGLVDRIEVCDTGSVDGTVALAEASGANVIHREWRNDFAWARNQVLEQCRDAAYVLLVDADDRVRCEDPEQLRRYLATYEQEYHAFEVRVDSPDAGTGSSIRSVRIVKADLVEFKGAIHEQPVLRDHPDAQLRGNQLDLLWIDHIGYLPEVAARKNKANRNLDIARAEYDAEPNFKTAIEYARSMIGAGGDKQQVVSLLREAHELAVEGPPPTRAYVGGILAANLVEIGEAEEAFELARDALRIVPADDMAAAAAARAAEALDSYGDLAALAIEIEGQPSMRPVFDAEDDRRYYEQAAVFALAKVGNLKLARNRLVDVLHRYGAFERWEALLDIVSSSADVVAWLDPIVSEFNEIEFLPWVKEQLPPEKTAEVCARFIRSGGHSTQVALLGVVSGLVSGRPELVSDLIDGLQGLADEQLRHLATVASSRGFDDAAAALLSVA